MSCVILDPNCADTSRPKFGDILRKKFVNFFFVSNTYNKNIGTFWRRKLCMETWYNSTSL